MRKRKAQREFELNRVGQIQNGDKVTTDYKGKFRREIWPNVKVLNPGESHEEVVLDSKRNIYFITRMVLDGTSWATGVTVSGRE